MEFRGQCYLEMLVLSPGGTSYYLEVFEPALGGPAIRGRVCTWIWLDYLGGNGYAKDTSDEWT